MPNLADTKSTTWDKNKYSKLSFDWAGDPPLNPKKVSVKNPRSANPTTYTVPQQHIQLTKSKDGSLTNNAGATISYTLS